MNKTLSPANEKLSLVISNPTGQFVDDVMIQQNTHIELDSELMDAVETSEEIYSSLEEYLNRHQQKKENDLNLNFTLQNDFEICSFGDQLLNKVKNIEESQLKMEYYLSEIILQGHLN